MGTLVTGDGPAAQPVPAPAPDNGFAGKSTPDEQRKLDTLYDGKATYPPMEKNALYGLPLLSTAIDSRGAELWTATGASSAEQRDLREMFVGIATSTHLPESLVASIAESHIDGLLADGRAAAGAVDESAVLNERNATWTTETRAVFTNTYGRDTEVMLGRVQKFVLAHPPLAEVLKRRGLGSRPDIVLGIAAHVHSTGYR